MRASKITMLFGNHSMGNLQRYKNAFDVLDHSKPKRVFVSELGGVSLEVFESELGSDAVRNLRRCVKQNKTKNPRLSRDIRELNRIFDEELAEEIRGSKAMGPARSFEEAAQFLADDEGYVVKIERIQPAAYVASFRKEEISNAFGEQWLGRSAFNFRKLVDLVRRQYQLAVRNGEIRDPAFLRQIDELAADFDAVVTFRGDGHQAFFERLDDSPSIARFTNEVSLFDSVAIQGKPVKFLDDADICQLLKGKIATFLQAYAGISEAEAIALVARLPNEIGAVEAFFRAFQGQDIVSNSQPVSEYLLAIQ
ncbi:MAG: hypothetical protein ABIE84_02930 [bacterium]